MSDKLYTVSQDRKDTFNIIDARKGTTVNRIIIAGEIVNGPVVVGDRCTFVVKTSDTQRFGVIYKLPNGTIINRFIV